MSYHKHDIRIYSEHIIKTHYTLKNPRLNTRHQTKTLMLNTSIITEQCTHTQSQASEDDCTSIRNMLSKKKIKQVTSVGLSLFNFLIYCKVCITKCCVYTSIVNYLICNLSIYISCFLIFLASSSMGILEMENCFFLTCYVALEYNYVLYMIYIFVILLTDFVP